MNPLALLDPWVIRFDGRAADAERLRLLADLRELKRKNIVDAAKFVPPTFSENSRTLPREVLAIITSLIRSGSESCSAAGLLDEPVPPDLDSEWLGALHDCVDPAEQSPRWRDPFILVPHSRRQVWPRMSEVRVNAGGATVSRVICEVQDLQDANAHRDLDPWRLHPIVGAPVAHALPRPPQLTGLPLEQWSDAVEKLADWTCNQPGRRFFVPDLTQPLHLVDKPTWRAGKSFRRAHGKHTAKCTGTGHFVDRWGRVWCWDPRHQAHWDVSEDGSPVYWRVLVDGTYAGEKPSSGR